MYDYSFGKFCVCMWGVVSGFDVRVRFKMLILIIVVYCVLVMVVFVCVKVFVSCLFFVYFYYLFMSLYIWSLVCFVYLGIDIVVVDFVNYLYYYIDSFLVFDVLGVVKLNLGRNVSYFLRLFVVGLVRLGWLVIELLMIILELVVEDV